MSTRPHAAPSLVAARQRALLAWYDRHGRDLPWRRERTLYGTWIAETMLQQTTVEAVRPRWRAFLARFPDVAALAAAEESDVLAAWSGLGYYRRARHLHCAARQIVAAGEQLPRDHAGWRALAGVGDYAAGAIASIGLGLPEPAVDANVRRVLVRWHCADPGTAAALGPAAIRDLAAAHLPAARPGDWNEALMDLGAGPCRARQPDCGACPVRRLCAAGQAGTAAAVPPAAARRAPVDVATGSLVLQREDGRVLLLPAAASVVARVRGLGRPQRADVAGLFAGMAALPSVPWYHAPERLDTGLLERTWRRWLAARGWTRVRVVHAGAHRHAITHHRLLVAVAAARLDGADDGVAGRLSDLPGAAWRSPADPDLPLSTLARRSLAQVG